MKIHAGEIFHSYVRPHTKFDATESVFIHRITPEQIVDAPKLKHIMPKFIEFCGASLLVGHYVGLDVKFFNKAAEKIFGSTIENPCIDTMYLAQAYTEKCWTQYHDQYNLQISYNLADLSEAYNLPTFKQHAFSQGGLTGFCRTHKCDILDLFRLVNLHFILIIKYL